MDNFIKENRYEKLIIGFSLLIGIGAGLIMAPYTTQNVKVSKIVSDDAVMKTMSIDDIGGSNLVYIIKDTETDVEYLMFISCNQGDRPIAVVPRLDSSNTHNIKLK